MQHIITMSKRCSINHLAQDEEKIIILNTKHILSAIGCRICRECTHLQTLTMMNGGSGPILAVLQCQANP